ncbi:MAG: hypothetical protein JKY19_04760 [Alcanivoracaceae bacterium]|nr:hypothetical protein [Alcanivoracaceae bacterium]
MNKRLAVIVWCLTLVISGYYAITHLSFEANILKLLPKYDSETTSALIDKASAKINDKLIIVVAAKSQEIARKDFLQHVVIYQKSGLFKQIKSEIELDQYQQLYKELLKYRYLMMAKDDQLAVEKYPDFNYFIDMAAAQLYGLVGYEQHQISSDPLFFFNHIINQLSEFGGLQIENDDGLFYVYKNKKHHYFAFAQLRESAFSPQYQQNVVDLINTSQRQNNHSDFYAFGSILYVHQAYLQAKGEISTVGVGSLIGILLLFIIVFRSLTPLIISISSIALGLVFALAITTLVFSKVHLFALVFGSTIAGVSIDYCFHYLCESVLNKDRKNIIPHISAGLIIGFASSAMVYLGFVITGYQVLAQISLFSICGLFAVLINVMLLFPLLVKSKSMHSSNSMLRMAGLLINNPLAIFFNSLPKMIVLFAITAFANWYWLNPNDDVRALQSLSSDLQQEESYIRDVLSLKADGRYALIHAKSIDELLTIESQVIAELRKQDKNITGISDFIPAIEQQQKHQQFYQKLYQSNVFKSYIINNGLDSTIITSQLLQVNEKRQIDYQLFENNAIKNLLTQRWLSKVAEVYALAIPLTAGMKISQHQQVVIVQQAADATKLFAKFRVKSLNIVIIAAFTLLLLLAFFRYGLTKAMHIVMLPFFAGLSALLITQICGFHISLFSILALLLILGMGLDYVVFLCEAKNSQHVMFALMLSSITTVLSFGLLSLSSVAVIKSFGFTVALGILTILFIAPAILNPGKTDAKQ